MIKLSDAENDLRGNIGIINHACEDHGMHYKNNESVAIIGAQSGTAQLTSSCHVSWTVFIAFKMVSSPKASDDATSSKYHAVNL